MVEDNFLKDCLDLIEDGIIVVDRDMTIQVYNKRAREIFGIDFQAGENHPPGSIANGDIVIFADNCLGADDGGLSPQDLNMIGIPSRAVKSGDAVIAAGRYNVPCETPYYKVVSGDNLNMLLTLSCCINNRDSIHVVIDNFLKVITISVNDRIYEMSYQIAIGHLVVLDGETGRLKFYQARGYTARGEDAGHILRGKQFMAKGTNSPVPHLIGEKLAKIHPDNEGARYLDMILNGQSKGTEEKEYLINGIWVRCSAYPIYGQKKEVIGGALIFRDINELKLFEMQVRDKGFKYPSFAKIVGNSSALMEAVRIAQRVSKSKSTVLLLGESGTGKGLFAKAIHENSSRAENPFIVVNMAAIPSGLLESELFGYEEGAFTGARKSGEIGKLRQANGGTIFLDEIGEMDFYLQAKLLHVLQDGHFYPVGSSRPVKLDVRIIAATNRNLEEEVKKKNFREDLFYRLNVVSITIPPLRERKEDITELVEYMLPLIVRKVGRQYMEITPDVYESFYKYNWPGNIRELENVLERAVNIAEGNVITKEFIPGYMKANKSKETAVTKERVPFRNFIEEAEREAILQALQASYYQKTAAIKLLQIGRTAFYKKVKKYGIKLNPGVLKTE